MMLLSIMNALDEYFNIYMNMDYLSNSPNVCLTPLAVTIFFLCHVFFLVSVVWCPYFCFAPLHKEMDSYLLAFPLHSDSFIVPL